MAKAEVLERWGPVIECNLYSCHLQDFCYLLDACHLLDYYHLLDAHQFSSLSLSACCLRPLQMTIYQFLHMARNLVTNRSQVLHLV